MPLLERSVELPVTVSARVQRQFRDLLEILATRRGKCVSDLVREALSRSIIEAIAADEISAISERRSPEEMQRIARETGFYHSSELVQDEIRRLAQTDDREGIG